MKARKVKLAAGALVSKAQKRVVGNCTPVAMNGQPRPWLVLSGQTNKKIEIYVGVNKFSILLHQPFTFLILMKNCLEIGSQTSFDSL